MRSWNMQEIFHDDGGVRNLEEGVKIKNKLDILAIQETYIKETAMVKLDE